MKVLITGDRGLAEALGKSYSMQSVFYATRSAGYDIKNVEAWGDQFLDVDLLFNCAYDGFGQVQVLEFFYNAWKNDPSKVIVSIGSKVIYSPRLDIQQDHEYWPYRLHKQALALAHETMVKNAKCTLKLINPGPIDTDMIAHQQCKKANPALLATNIKDWITNPFIKRVDL